MEKVRYMISDAANIVNVESHVLRYWEDELELDIPRNEMGHRYYTKENIQEFQRIKELKEQGYQLKAIRMIVHNGSMEGQMAELAAGVKAAPDLHQVQAGAGKEQPPRAKAQAEAPAQKAVGQPQGVRQSASGQTAATGAQPYQGSGPVAGVREAYAPSQGSGPVQGAPAQGSYPATGTSPQGTAPAGGEQRQMTGLNGQAGQAAGLRSQMEHPAGAGAQAAGLNGRAGQAAGLKAAQSRPTGAEVKTMEPPGTVEGQLKVRESRQSILNNTDKMAQFTDLMTQIVGKAIAANNHELSRNISDDVGEQVIKELNYLMREREEAEEERFRKLDVAIRGSLKKKEPRRKKWKQKKLTEEPGSV